ncbi:MAG: TetR/AcrR family transcriptional regulator [Cyanobacteria bacterium P01_A01_bin.68]
MSPIAASKSYSEAKRDKILAVASELFLELGYNRVSVNAIVRKAGGTKTNIYTYFGGKEGLFRAIIESLSKEISQSLVQIDITNLSPQEALNAFGRKYLSVVFSKQAVELHRLTIAESRQFPELGRIWYQAGPEDGYQELGKYIFQQQQLGRFKNYEPRLAATQFLGMLESDIYLQLMLGLRETPSDKEIDTLVSETVKAFLLLINED